MSVPSYHNQGGVQPPGYPSVHPGAPPTNYPHGGGYPPPQQGYPQGNAAYIGNTPSSSHQSYGAPQSNLPTLPSAQCTSKIEFRISCKNLLDRDVLSKSDPMVVVSLKHNNRWYEIGRTENIKNCLNPEFSKCIPCDYYFEAVQNVRFQVYDLDNTTPELSDDDFLGQMECTIGQACADEVEGGNNEMIYMSFAGKGLDKKDFFGKSDPFLEFKRKLPNGTYLLCHRTEYIPHNLNPTWKPIQIDKRTLCAGNAEEEITILCYDYDNDGGHDFIGECTTSLAKMAQEFQQQQTVTWTLMNPKKLAKKGHSYKGSGTLMLKSFQSLTMYSFLDYITTGTQLNFIVAVDFTASNGDPRHPNSLHYIDRYRPNEYMQAISAVGAVLQDYDTDKMFPALGFGAKIPPQYAVSHEFALNFNMSNPFCSGVQGLLDAYSNCLQQVQLYGPTNVAPMIIHAARFARTAFEQSQPNDYFVLMILTDGVITDMDNTRTAIVNASSLPLSIIIIGVGQADFSDMNLLDGDDGILRAPNGMPANRDIVQFVPFQKFKSNPTLLTSEVLAEIPKQVVEFYRQRKMPPKAPQQQLAPST